MQMHFHHWNRKLGMHRPSGSSQKEQQGIYNLFFFFSVWTFYHIDAKNLRSLEDFSPPASPENISVICPTCTLETPGKCLVFSCSKCFVNGLHKTTDPTPLLGGRDMIKSSSQSFTEILLAFPDTHFL